MRQTVWGYKDNSQRPNGYEHPLKVGCCYQNLKDKTEKNSLTPEPWRMEPPGASWVLKRILWSSRNWPLVTNSLLSSRAYLRLWPPICHHKSAEARKRQSCSRKPCRLVVFKIQEWSERTCFSRRRRCGQESRSRAIPLEKSLPTSFNICRPADLNLIGHFQRIVIKAFLRLPQTMGNANFKKKSSAMWGRVASRKEGNVIC
jgi:hypothetical protein